MPIPHTSHKRIITLIIILIIALLSALSFYFISSKGDTTQEISSQQNNPEIIEIEAIFNNIKEYERSSINSVGESMNAIATDRTVLAVDTSSFAYTNTLGYKFKTPWGKGKESDKTKNSPYMKQIIFSNGRTMIITCGTTTPRQEFTNEDPESGDSLPIEDDIKQILDFLGPKADSGFDYMNELLSITPDNIKKSTTLNEASAISKLLIIKTSILASGKKTYRFTTGSIKGFQFGDWSAINLVLFPKNTIRCDVMSKQDNNTSQSDIDTIISTFSLE